MTPENNNDDTNTGNSKPDNSSNGVSPASGVDPDRLSVSAHGTPRGLANKPRGLRNGLPVRTRSSDGVVKNLPRRIKSADGAQRRMFAGLRGGRKPVPMKQQGPVMGVIPLDMTDVPPEPAIMTSRSLPSTPNHSFKQDRDAKNRARVRATVPGAAAVGGDGATAPEPLAPLSASSAHSTPGRTLSGDSGHGGKMRRITAATTPGAVRESNVLEPSLSPLTSRSSHAASPVAMASNNNNTSSSSSPPTVTHQQQQQQPVGDGKIRGRARATAPGAVSSHSEIAPEPISPVSTPLESSSFHKKSLAAAGSSHSRAATARRVGLGRSKAAPDATSESVIAPEPGSSPIRASTPVSPLGGAGGSNHSRTSTTRRSGLAGGRPKAAPGEAKLPAADELDPQAIRRKQMQEIQRDTTLSQKEKAAKMQQLMAGGMPKSAPAATSAVEDEIVIGSAPPPQSREQKIGVMHSPDTATTSESDEALNMSDDEDPEETRRREIHDIMNDPHLTQREKTMKTQELMANVIATSTKRDDEPRGAGRRTDYSSETIDRDGNSRSTRSRTNSPVVTGARGLRSMKSGDADSMAKGRPNSPTVTGTRGLRRTNTNDSGDSGPRSAGLGIRRINSNDTGGSGPRIGGRGLRRNLSSEGGSSPCRPAAVMPTPGTDLGDELISQSLHVDSRNNSAHGFPCKTVDVGKGSTHSMLDGSIRSLDDSGFHDDKNENSTNDMGNSASSMNQSSKSIGSSQRISRRTRIALMTAPEEETAPGASSVIQKAEPSAAIGVGGTPRGKTLTGAASRVTPYPSSTGASTGVGGAPQGKVRRVTTTPATMPGAVSVVEYAATSSAPAEPGVSSGVGGAPQGKMRRVTTAPASRPGAVSVSESVHAPQGSTTREPGASGVGGAPQGKMRRVTDIPATRPGAVSVVESAPSSIAQTEPGRSTGVGGAPQGKIRRVTTPVTAPGAVSVVESFPSNSGSEPGASTGVGGAPQGKMRRVTTTPTTMPGAVSVVESVFQSNAPREPGASTGVGGAPQGKMRRVTTTPATMPGAVSMVESTRQSNTSSEPGASTVIGGAPQGKMRVTTAPALRPGAVSVVEPNSAPSEVAASTGVGGAPQGKMRRTTTSTSTPGAVSVREPSSVPSEPGVVTGLGGAPQGKMRRTTNQTTRPGAVSVVEPTVGTPEPGAQAGVGGAPQGKMRRTSAEATARSDSVQNQDAAFDPPRHLLAVSKEPRTLIPAVPVRSMQTSNHGGANKNVSLPPPLLGAAESQDGGVDDDAVISSIEQDMLAKNRGRRAATATVTPGAQSVTSEKHSSTLGESDAMIKARARGTVDRGFRNQMDRSERSVMSDGSEKSVGSTGASRGLGSIMAPSSRGLGSNMAPSSRGLRNSTAPSIRGLGSLVPSTRGLNTGKFHSSFSNNSSFGHESVNSIGSDYSDAIAEPDSIDRRRIRSAPTNVRVTANNDHIPTEDDFSQALALAEEDMRIKMNIRDQAGDRALVPGAQQASAFDSQDSRRKSSRTGMAEGDDPALDDSLEKVSIKVGSHQATKLPTTVQGRMEQKILQMEQEQRARDAKLEELEELNVRRNDRGRQRRKDGTSPHPGHPGDTDDDSDPIENGFLNPDPDAIRQAEEDGLAIAIAIQEEDEPDVYDVELKMYDPEAKPPFYKHRRFQCYTILICLLTLAAIIAASVISARNGGEVILITQAPSSAPSSAPTTTRETAVRGELARVIGEIVNEEGTPYEKAMDWILYQDAMQLDEFSNNLIQRYILALFYFQTSQQGPWLSCNPWDEDPACVFLEHTRMPDNSVTYVPRNKTEIRWLSDKHECQWAEVLCHPETDGNVIAIDILGQNLTGTMPDELRHLDRLMWLTLSFNHISGTIPEVYGEFPYLTIFECTETMITGTIPSGFFKQSNLLQLNLVYTLITGTIPPEIGDLTTLHSLFFYNTGITGTLPTEMGRLGDARNIWLYDNALSGPVPSELGELSLLETLKLSANLHVGPLPSEVGRLNKLEEFMFSGNDMGGTTIPEEIWSLSSLIFMDLQDSGFAGTISTNIGKMKSLVGLALTGNSLSGTVPTEIGLLSNLYLLKIHKNENLGGEVPLEICYLPAITVLNADCAENVGTPARITCQCCTGCCDEFGTCQIV